MDIHTMLTKMIDAGCTYQRIADESGLTPQAIGLLHRNERGTKRPRQTTENAIGAAYLAVFGEDPFADESP